MFPGLYELIVAFVLAAIVYYVGTIVPNVIVQRIATAIAIIIAVIGLLSFLRHYLGA